MQKHQRDARDLHETCETQSKMNQDQHAELNQFRVLIVLLIWSKDALIHRGVAKFTSAPSTERALTQRGEGVNGTPLCVACLKQLLHTSKSQSLQLIIVPHSVVKT